MFFWRISSISLLFSLLLYNFVNCNIYMIARSSLKPNYIHKCTKLKICKIQYFIATLHKNSIYATRRFKHLHLEIERIT